MSNFDMAVMIVLKHEGGLSHDENDAGGVTNMGISLRFLKSCDLKYDFDQNGIVDNREIENLTIDQAKLIYLQEFWLKAPFEKINNQNVTNYIFDAAVNMGIEPAVAIAQRAVWALTISRNLADDGILGSKTIEELNHGGIMLLPPLRAERAAYYKDIVNKFPVRIKELNGWLNRAYGF